MIKKILLGLVGVLVLVVGLGFVFSDNLIDRMMERVVERNMSTDLLAELPDGLHVALCGAGSPMPDLKRSGPCVAVIAGRHLYIVDSGSGGSKQLGLMRIPQGQIEAVFLTHFHSDHIDGLGELALQRWVGASNTSPLPLYGPTGVGRVARGFNEAYAQDFVYRVAHHGAKTVPPTGAGLEARPFLTPAPDTAQVVYQVGDVKVTAFSVDHSPVHPAMGYRFDYKGRSVVISGDTKRSPMVQIMAKDADLLMHEALNADMVKIMEKAAKRAGRPNIEKVMQDIPDYHTTPVEAAKTAKAAGVDALLFYHIVPPLPLGPMKRRFVRSVADIYDGPFEVAEDGTSVSMPAGSDEIIFGSLK